MNMNRLGVMDGLWQILQEESDAELQDKSGIDPAILAEIEMLKSKWENDSVHFECMAEPVMRD